MRKTINAVALRDFSVAKGESKIQYVKDQTYPLDEGDVINLEYAELVRRADAAPAKADPKANPAT